MPNHLLKCLIGSAQILCDKTYSQRKAPQKKLHHKTAKCAGRKSHFCEHILDIRAQSCQCVDFNNIACTMQFLNIIWTCEKYFYRQFTNGKSDHKMNLSAIDRMELHWAEIFGWVVEMCRNGSSENGFFIKTTNITNHQIYMKFDEVLHSQHHNTMLNNVHLCFRTQTVESSMALTRIYLCSTFSA